MRLFSLALIAGVLAASGGGPAAEESAAGTGLYLILADADSPGDLPELSAEQQVLPYDYKFLRDDERRPPRYLLLPRRANVPFLLAKRPEAVVGERGFTELLIQLTEEAAAEMERFTGENIGRSAAFLIDGEVITAHKIRAVIKDGRLQLSRCNDNACEYILARLETP